MESKLRDALELVRNGEMCKEVLRGDNGSHCSLGFLLAAHGFELHTHDDEAYMADTLILGQVLGELFPERTGDLAPWNATDELIGIGITAAVNNHPDTVKEDLIVAFGKAAIKAEEII